MIRLMAMIAMTAMIMIIAAAIHWLGVTVPRGGGLIDGVLMFDMFGTVDPVLGAFATACGVHDRIAGGPRPTTRGEHGRIHPGAEECVPTLMMN